MSDGFDLLAIGDWTSITRGGFVMRIKSVLRAICCALVIVGLTGCPFEWPDINDLVHKADETTEQAE